MRPNFFLIVLFLCVGFAYSQQSQTSEDPFSYKVVGLFYIQEYTVATKTKTTTTKIPKSPLKFKIVGTEIDPTDNSSFYILQFSPISVETGTIATLVNSTTFVNSGDNNKYFWIRKDAFDRYFNDKIIVKSYSIPNINFTYGANISIPFKLRPKVNDLNIKITPELTLGGYIGAKSRISPSKRFYMSFPVVTLGLATLSINDDNTDSETKTGDGTVLGYTGSTGIIFQFDDFQFGLMVGKDRAAGEIGKNWIYNDKVWYSFSIGYSFIGDKEKTNNP